MSTKFLQNKQHIHHRKYYGSKFAYQVQEGNKEFTSYFCSPVPYLRWLGGWRWKHPSGGKHKLRLEPHIRICGAPRRPSWLCWVSQLMTRCFHVPPTSKADPLCNMHFMQCDHLIICIHWCIHATIYTLFLFITYAVHFHFWRENRQMKQYTRYCNAMWKGIFLWGLGNRIRWWISSDHLHSLMYSRHDLYIVFIYYICCPLSCLTSE